jgi:hypothetical protein
LTDEKLFGNSCLPIELRFLLKRSAAALPMGALAWIIAPTIAGRDAERFVPTLIVALTAGLSWLVLLLIGFSWRGVWLRQPSTSDRHRDGRPCPIRSDVDGGARGGLWR